MSELLQSNLFEPEYTKSAVLSEDQVYRYRLERRWSQSGKTVAFICLNPSTADAEIDDPTVRKCMRLARRWGGGRLVIGNLFAFRSTDPKNLYKCAEPIGSENDVWLKKIVEESDILVAAWGTNGSHLNRNKEILNLFSEKFHALKLTKDGHPSHPLYLAESLIPFLISVKGYEKPLL